MKNTLSTLIFCFSCFLLLSACSTPATKTTGKAALSDDARLVKCTSCKGTGFCSSCRGSGQGECASCRRLQSSNENRTCSICNGTGSAQCYSCRGNGLCTSCNGGGVK